MKKISTVFILFIIILLFLVPYTFAFNITDLNGTPLNNADATNIGNTLITVLSTIGSITSVIVLILIGLKYMLGSVEEKAEYKKSLLPYIIGASIVFGASFFAGVLYNIVK